MLEMGGLERDTNAAHREPNMELIRYIKSIICLRDIDSLDRRIGHVECEYERLWLHADTAVNPVLVVRQSRYLRLWFPGLTKRR